MNKVEKISSLRAAVSAARKDKKTISFVPTMGNLHEGHLELVRVAKRRADFVIVSIYVNPTQFGKNEDLENYPSTPDDDARLLAELGVDVLFLPNHETIYPGELSKQTVVYVPEISDMYCGKDRPEHFYGVTTVVSRLFNMVQPDVAVFGNKDYQQVAIIRRMVEDLAYPVQIVGVDTQRNEQGLALSSRNGYLTDKQTQTARHLQATLQNMSESLRGSSSVKSKAALAELEKSAKAKLKKLGFKPQYITVARQSDLMPAKKGDQALVILAAASIGRARLIDNVEVQLGEGI
ncbi:MAG: pantoate--beta-alanine ligase [Gammaproteobacteria bacterium]|nr:pantoate--beta-alanine ligase [Gammaproteobacteria bacterium]